jgi:DNA-binding NarL/FixJ family response regulator
MIIYSFVKVGKPGSKPWLFCVVEVDNGNELIQKLQSGIEPDLILMDINMPVLDGYETTKWIKENKPLIKVLALSMYDDEKAIMKMLRNGARGYILKDSEPAELRMALEAVITKAIIIQNW